jgi:hypothetical protein
MALTSAEKSAAYRAKDVEEYRRKKREYAKTPEQKAKRTAYMSEYRAKNRDKTNETARISHEKTKRSRTPEQRHNQHLKSFYGIDRDEFLAILEEQEGCAICGSKTSRWGRNFHVDHCHETHKIRGILCNRCNPMLGWFESRKDKVLEYLNKDISGNKEVRTPSKSKSRKSD